VEKGEYGDKEILVGHYNPLIPRKQVNDKMDEYVEGDVEKFEEGAKHKLVLITPIETVWNEALEDEYFDQDVDKYYALEAETVKK
jgi:BioD-like phosphotransacetylase family protein